MIVLNKCYLCLSAFVVSFCSLCYALPVIRTACLLAFISLAATSLSAQSLDPNTPFPVRSSNVSGRIAARDLGDARLTDHYYAFTGTPGDLLITVQTNNLNGDVDVFTAVTLRSRRRSPRESTYVSAKI